MRQVLERLRAAVKGDVWSDAGTRYMYSTGACIHQIMPVAVAAPRDADDVAAVLAVARSAGVPIIARGAGSSRAGQPLGSGIVLDFSRYMNKVVDLAADAGTVTVQPGIVLDRLNQHLRSYGRQIGPDPTSFLFATIGGMIANNSSGEHFLRHGNLLPVVQALDVMLVDGTRVRLSRQDAAGQPERQLPPGLQAGLEQLLLPEQELINAQTPVLPKNVAGYNLQDAVAGGVLRPLPLLVGSEGTLAITLAATLDTAPLPGPTAVALIALPRLEDAATVWSRVRKYDPGVLEVADARLLQLRRAEGNPVALALGESCEGAVVVELEAASDEALQQQIAGLSADLARHGLTADVATSPAGKDAFWTIRKNVQRLSNKMHPRRRAVAFIEDCVVQPPLVPQFMRMVRAVLDEHGVSAAMYGHLGEGNVHLYPVLDLYDPADVGLMARIADQVFDWVLAHGGSISGEHGDGTVRGAFLPRAVGPLYPLYESVKRLFDPDGLLNPGKKVTRQGYGLTDNLRYRPVVAQAPAEFVQPEPRTWIIDCHGCGRCRWFCPAYTATGDEHTTPRARANVLRGIITGALDPADRSVAASLKASGDACLYCHRCIEQCPAGVDGGALAAAIRAYRRRRGGRSLRDRLLANPRRLFRLAGAAPRLTRFLAANRPARRLLAATLGISADAPLPVPPAPPLPTGLQHHREQAGAAKVVYFSGCYSRLGDADYGWANWRILQRVSAACVHPDLVCCGMPALVSGDRDQALALIGQNLPQLYDWVRQGYQVVTGDPTCLLMLREHWPQLAPGPKTEAVAAATVEIHDFLLGLIRDGRWQPALRAEPLRAGYMVSCHLHTQGLGRGPLELLSLVPELELAAVTDQCCGGGGTCSLKVENAALAAGAGAAAMAAMAQDGLSILTTSCGACKIQLEHRLGRTVVHPLQIIERALEG